MFKDDYKSMMDDVPVNEALRAELLKKAQIAEESKSNVVKIPFIRRHTKSIASIAACVVIAAAAVGVVPNLMEEENPATTEVYEVPTSTKTPAPIQTDEEYEAALEARVTEEPADVTDEAVDKAVADTTGEPVYTLPVIFGTNTGIVQGGTALQTIAPAAADESKTQTSGSSAEATDSGETAHTHTAVTTEETETASTSAARAAENIDTDAAAGISTTALEEEKATAVTSAPTPAASNGVLSYSSSSSSAASSSGASSGSSSSGSSTSGSSSSSSSSSGSVSSSSSASSSSSSSSSSARSYSRSVIDYDSAAAYVENASNVFIVNGVKVGAYESVGSWRAYYVADNVGYVVTFTGYDALSDIKDAIKVYI